MKPGARNHLGAFHFLSVLFFFFFFLRHPSSLGNLNSVYSQVSRVSKFKSIEILGLRDTTPLQLKNKTKKLKM